MYFHYLDSILDQNANEELETNLDNTICIPHFLWVINQKFKEHIIQKYQTK
jgi:hypothetical protein